MNKIYQVWPGIAPSSADKGGFKTEKETTLPFEKCWQQYLNINGRYLDEVVIESRDFHVRRAHWTVAFNIWRHIHWDFEHCIFFEVSQAIHWIKSSSYSGV